MRLITHTLLIFIFCQNLLFSQSQYPSPMVEFSRTHERVEKPNYSGRTILIEDILSKPLEVYIPNQKIDHDSISLLIHFHGSSYVPIYAVENSENPFVVATINLGHGSSAYEKPFVNNDKFTEMIAAISDSSKMVFSNIFLSVFSAGYGSVRAILKNPNYFDKIDGIVLLDGLHTDYIPEKLLLAEGGKLNIDKLNCFLEFAKQAVKKEKIFIITHSEIFPGTYASTTEAANYLINEIGLKRKSVLKWGVLGMQQTSEVNVGNFYVFGFAGNTAPDHIDHFHTLFNLIQYLI